MKWLEHHWNRLYGVNGLVSKKAGWMDGVEWSGVDTPKTVMTTREHPRCSQ